LSAHTAIRFFFVSHRLLSLLQTAKEEALCELTAEKRLRVDAEERCVEFSHKMAELEAQLRAMQTTAASQVCTAQSQ